MRVLIVLAVIAAAHEAHAGACGSMLGVEAASPQLATDGLVLLDTLEMDVPLDKATIVTADGAVIPTRVVRRAGQDHRV